MNNSQDIALGGGAVQSFGILISTEVLSHEVTSLEQHRFGPISVHNPIDSVMGGGVQLSF